MDSYTVHEQAQELEIMVSPYQLARRLIEAEEQLTKARRWLNNPNNLKRNLGAGDGQALVNILYDQKEEYNEN